MTVARLEPEQRELLDLVRAFAHNTARPAADACEREGRFPRELIAQMAGMDLMGLPFAVTDGGGGQPQTVYLRVVEELSRAFMALGLGLSVHTLSTWAVANYAPEPLRGEVLPRMTAGEWLGAYSLSEPGSGSDAAALVTKARREGDSYVVDGVKAWVTHQGVADVYVLMCRTGEHKSRGISTLLVRDGTAGLSFPPVERKMGMRASPTGQLVFDGARVPATDLLGEEGEGFKIAMSALDGGRLGIAAASVGLAQRCLDEALAYAQQRTQFGQPIADFQGVAFLLADMATAVEAARALYLEAADRRDLGLPYGRLASMAKLSASDAAMSNAIEAVQLHGGYGYTEDYPVERFMREAKMLQIVEGTNQVQRMVISRDLLREGERHAVTNPARDRETVRRALWAGALAWLVAAVGLGVASFATRRTMQGETAALIVAVAFVVGGLAASLWLMLANVLDLLAGSPAGLRRWLWTAGILVVTALVFSAVSVVAG